MYKVTPETIISKKVLFYKKIPFSLFFSGFFMLIYDKKILLSILYIVKDSLFSKY